MRKILVLALLAMSVITSCKKDKKDISLEGKWNVDAYTVNYYDDYILEETETVPGDGSTFDFQTNGQLVVFQDGATESQPYNILPDSKVVVAGDTLEIRNLTASTVTLYFQDAFSASEYAEIIIDLKR
jgi:hypothetical protein